MAETRTRTPLGDSPGGLPQPPADQARHRLAEDGALIKLGRSLSPLYVAELALAAGGLTWRVLTYIGMGDGPAIFPAVLACFFTARAANRLRIRAAEVEDSEQAETGDEALPEDRSS